MDVGPEWNDICAAFAFLSDAGHRGSSGWVAKYAGLINLPRVPAQAKTMLPIGFTDDTISSRRRR